MIAEKTHTEPSMDEILASIRKIISTDSQESMHSGSHSFYPSERHEEILDLTNALPEEPRKAQEPLHSPEFHMNDAGEWPPAADSHFYLGETADNAQSYPYGAPTSSSFEESLISQATLSETMQAFHILNTLEQEKEKSSQERGAGQPLEALIKDMLKPLLKEWLDANLPVLVRSVVTQQVEKIVNQAGRD